MAAQIAPWFALAIGLGLRLWRIDLTRFYEDQVLLLQSVFRLIDHGEFPLHTGFTFSVGIWVPPLPTYLFAVPALFSHNPVWISGFVAAVDSLGCLVTYATAKRLSSSPWVAFAAALAYAVAPSGLLFGRMIWNANFVPLLGSVALWGLVDFLERKRSPSLGIALVATGCMAQLHIVAGVYLLIWLTIAIVYFRKIQWRHQLLAGAALLATVAPYIAFEAQSAWADVSALRQFADRPSVTNLETFDTAAELAGAATFWRMLPGGFPGQWFHYDGLSWALIGLTLLGLGWALMSRRASYLALAVWLALPVLLTIRHSQRVWPWYLLGGVPAMVLLQALGLDRLSQAVAWLGSHMRSQLDSKRLASLITPVLALGLASALSVAYLEFQTGVAATSRDDKYGVPLRYSIEAAQQVASIVGPQPMYLAAPENHSPVIPFLAGAPSWERRYSGRTVVLLPPEPKWYIAAADGLANGFLMRFAGSPAASVKTTDGSIAFALFRVPGEADVLSRPDFVPLGIQVGSGIRMEGYIAHQLAAGQPSQFDLLWRVTDAQALAQLRFSEFAHLVDESGRVWSATPDLWNIVEPWGTGDLVVWPAQLNIDARAPVGGYWLETGFYETFSGKPLPVTQPGQQGLTGIRVGPLRVAGNGLSSVSTQPLATFGAGEISLMNAHLQGNDVVLEWQAAGKPRADYTAFVHLLDASGKLVDQDDRAPGGNSYPTGIWEPGDTVRDVHHLSLAPAPGMRLEAGLYMPANGHRLAAELPAGGPGDHLLLALDSSGALRPTRLNALD